MDGDRLSGDTLHGDEQVFLRRHAPDAAPTHRFLLETSRDGVVWAVLEPDPAIAGLPKFTIGRVAPSVIVMVEDAEARRQFCSTPSVEEAMRFVQAVTHEAFAARNLHAAHPVPQ